MNTNHLYFKNKEYLKDNGHCHSTKVCEKYIKKQHLDLYEKLIKFSKTYDIQSSPFSLLVWSYMNDIKSIPKCKQCNSNTVKWLGFSKGYRTYCSRKCLNRSDIKKSKSKETFLKKYNVENPFQCKEFQDKIKETNFNKYGVEHPLQSKEFQDKSRHTCLEKYGVEHVSQVESFKDKSKRTCLVKYGAENPMQNKEVFNKQQKSVFKKAKFKNTNIHYQGSYELDFLNRYYDEILIENGPSIKYKFKGKNKVYHSDFYLPERNIIIEVKSDYTYKVDMKKNLEKEKACLEQGYNFIFIIDKDYDILKII